MKVINRETIAESLNIWARQQNAIAKRTYLKGKPLITNWKSSRSSLTREPKDVINKVPQHSSMGELLASFFALEIRRTSDLSTAAERMLIHFLVSGGLEKVTPYLMYGESEKFEEALEREINKYILIEHDDNSIRDVFNSIEKLYVHSIDLDTTIREAKFAPAYYNVKTIVDDKSNKEFQIEKSASFKLPCGTHKEVWEKLGEHIDHMRCEGRAIVYPENLRMKEVKRLRSMFKDVDQNAIVFCNGMAVDVSMQLPQPNIHVIDLSQIGPNKRGAYGKDLEAFLNLAPTLNLSESDVDHLPVIYLSYNASSCEMNVVDGMVDDKMILQRVEQIEQQVEDANSTLERHKQLERLVNLCGIEYIVRPKLRFEDPYIEYEYADLFECINKMNSERSTYYVQHKEKDLSHDVPFYTPLFIGVGEYDIMFFIDRLKSIMKCIYDTEIAVKKYL